MGMPIQLWREVCVWPGKLKELCTVRCGSWEYPREGKLEFGAKCEDVGS